MRVVTDLPRPVRLIEHVWIPLSDGTRLGARIWLAEDADTVMEADAERFRITTELEATENGREVRRRDWELETPRDMG